MIPVTSFTSDFGYIISPLRVIWQIGLRLKLRAVSNVVLNIHIIGVVERQNYLVVWKQDELNSLPFDPLTCVARGGGKALDMIDTHGGDVFGDYN